MSQNSNPASGITWNLSPIYNDLADPQIESDKTSISESVAAFTHKYKNTLSSKNQDVETIESSLNDYNAITERLQLLSSYSNLLHSKNSNDPAIGKFFQSTEEFIIGMSEQLVWFELYVSNLSPEIEVTEYSHYLNTARAFQPFQLSEPEERILTLKSQTSSKAFVRFFDETEALAQFELEIDGTKHTLAYPEIATIANDHPDRTLREKATKVISEVLESKNHTYTYILNTLVADKKISDQLRNFNSPEQSTLLSYEMKPETVSTMAEVVASNYQISQQFYELKKNTLNIGQLFEWDRYTPFIQETDQQYSWEEAKDIVIKSFRSASDQFGDIAQLFFDNNWIDAELSEGKRGGAFCSLGTPSGNPHILLNFTGKINDVMTLAHELGHGIHAYLAKENNALQFYPSTVTAEIASVFAESLVFDSLYESLENKDSKINLLSNRIQGAFATIFRQTAFYMYEQDIHNHYREQGELTTEEFSDYYQKRLQPMFGDALTLTDNHAKFWMPIMHFYHYSFYVFSYSFGELLSLALYDLYKNDKETFLPKYVDALKAGGSLTPYELTELMGVNINSKSFWENGMQLLESEISDLKKLLDSK